MLPQLLQGYSLVLAIQARTMQTIIHQQYNSLQMLLQRLQTIMLLPNQQQKLEKEKLLLLLIKRTE